MRNVLFAITGFLVGTALLIALFLVLPRTTNTKEAKPLMAQGGSGMMASASVPTARKLTILHVQKGCHVWSDGKATGAMMRLSLKANQKLSIVDQDVDAHQMVQFGGPMHLRMGGPMMMNRGMTLAFAQKGVYRLGTKTVEMSGGGGMAVKTDGPDNSLRLVVTVA